MIIYTIHKGECSWWVANTTQSCITEYTPYLIIPLVELDSRLQRTRYGRKVDTAEISAPSRDGAYINGLSLDGARWNFQARAKGSRPTPRVPPMLF